MYIDRDEIENYPYDGVFYRTEIDEDAPLDEREEKEVIVFETKCDITESSHSWSREFIWAKYAIYFPFDKEKDTIEVRLGDFFRANVHGLMVNGKVVGVFPSQLSGVTIYIQDLDV